MFLLFIAISEYITYLFHTQVSTETAFCQMVFYFQFENTHFNNLKYGTAKGKYRVGKLKELISPILISMRAVQHKVNQKVIHQYMGWGKICCYLHKP